MQPEIDLLAIDRASITAPAGCGKTQLIADNLLVYGGVKPILILTHTNAGVAALRGRLQRASVPSASYRVGTIDGFAMRLIGMFPQRSGHDPQILQVNAPREDYPAIRAAASQLVSGGHIWDALRATYARVIVDEYQDCNLTQHSMIDALSSVLATAVLGDPLQAIFGFSGNRLVHWQTNVEARFPRLAELATPWRWVNAGAESLGRWLLEARVRLQTAEGVDLRQAPAQVQWVPIDPAHADQQRRTAAQTRPTEQEQTVLIIGDSINRNSRYQMASQIPGATVVETVDLGELVGFARSFDCSATNALAQLLDFASQMMTQVSAANLLARIETIQKGRARTPPTQAEIAALNFVADPNLSRALLVLQRLEEQSNARVYRPEILHCCRTAMRATVSGEAKFVDAVLAARERNRYLGRPLSRRAVGSTLLLKGLEADLAILLHPESMDAPNLYVALTRGARRLIVCSEQPVLGAR